MFDVSSRLSEERREGPNRVRSGIARWVIPAFVVLVLGACGDDDPAADEAASVGPLALQDDALSGAEAQLEGELVVTDRCVFVDAPDGRRVLVGWSAESVSWDGASIVFDSPDHGRVVLNDGDVISIGGGGATVEEDGISYAEWVDRIDWVSEPDPSCNEGVDIWWSAGDLTDLPE